MLAATEIDDAHAARRRVRRGVGILIGSSVLFGVMAVCVRVAARELPPLQIAWVRFMGSFVRSGFTPASLGSLACATSVVTAAGLEALVLGTHLGSTVIVGAGFMVAAVGFAAGRAVTPRDAIGAGCV